MKTSISFQGVLSALLAVAAGGGAWAADPVLVGLWRFNDGSGEVAKDDSGLGNHGTLIGENGNLPVWEAGQTGFGGALRFVNNGVGHSYVDVPGNALLKIGEQAGEGWSLCIWAKESSEGTQDFYATYGRFMAQDSGFGFQWDSGMSGDPMLYLWHGNLATWRQGFGPFDSVPDLLDRWIHWAVVYDGQNLTLYRNGNEGTLGWKQAVAVTGSLTFDGYTGAIQIGTQLNMDGTRNWQGWLDDAAVFRGGLSEAQVRTVMKGDFAAFVGAGKPKIVGEPQDQKVPLGLDASFTVSASSQSALSYQWWHAGQALSGQTNATLTLPNIAVSQAGDYQAVVANSFGSVTSRVATLSVLTGPPRVVGLWRFEEGQGTAVADTSGMTNHGTLMGENDNLPTWSQGQTGFGKALQFQNNGADHAYVDVPASESLKIGQTANDLWSLAIWAKETSDGGGGYVATYGRFLAQDGGQGIQWDSGANGDSQVYLWHGTLGDWRYGAGTDGPATPLFDQWVHWALVYDGRNLTLYRNGNQGALGGKVTVPVHAALTFGGYTGAIQLGTQLNMSGDRTWNGWLDDAAMFSGALTEAQVRTVMLGDFSGFMGAPPTLAIARSGAQVTVNWDGGTLQSAPEVTGPWQDQADATSPLKLTPGDARRFFRARR